VPGNMAAGGTLQMLALAGSRSSTLPAACSGRARPPAGRGRAAVRAPRGDVGDRRPPGSRPRVDARRHGVQPGAGQGRRALPPARGLLVGRQQRLLQRHERRGVGAGRVWQYRPQPGARGC
jgi:hypothetical protein